MKNKFLIALLTILTANTYANEVAKQDWIAAMQARMPAAFCDKSTAFRQCFTIEDEQCKQAVQAAAKKCVAKYEGDIPAMLKQPADSKVWAQKLGACTGEAYETNAAKQKIASEKCDNMDSWK